jgi:hypothetical protein
MINRSLVILFALLFIYPNSSFAIKNIVNAVPAQLIFQNTPGLQREGLLLKKYTLFRFI